MHGISHPNAARAVSKRVRPRSDLGVIGGRLIGFTIVAAALTVTMSVKDGDGVAAGAPAGAANVRVLGNVEFALNEQLTQEFFNYTNDERVQKHLTPFVRRSDLDAAASHYIAKLTSGRLVHAKDLSEGISDRWLALGENLGRGRSVFAIHQAFMASKKHRENLLDERFTEMGISTISTESGIIVVQRFRQPEA